MVVSAVVMLEIRPGRHSGIMTLVMIWKGVAPMLWAASTTPSSNSRRLVSTRRATKGKAATISGTMVALVPTVVPTMARVSGNTQIIRIRKGTLRRMLMTMLIRCISQPGRGRMPSLSPATSSTPSGRPSTSAKAVESTVT